MLTPYIYLGSTADFYTMLHCHVEVNSLAPLRPEWQTVHAHCPAGLPSVSYKSVSVGILAGELLNMSSL